MADKSFSAKRGQTLHTDGYKGYYETETDAEMYLRVNREFQKWLANFGKKGDVTSTPLLRHIDYTVQPDKKVGKNELVMRVSYDRLDIRDGVCDSSENFGGDVDSWDGIDIG